MKSCIGWKSKNYLPDKLSFSTDKRHCVSSVPDSTRTRVEARVVGERGPPWMTPQGHGHSPPRPPLPPQPHCCHHPHTPTAPHFKRVPRAPSLLPLHYPQRVPPPPPPSHPCRHHHRQRQATQPLTTLPPPQRKPQPLRPPWPL